VRVLAREVYSGKGFASLLLRLDWGGV
jgi:hypothetical protein